MRDHPRTKIYFVVDDWWACAWYRCHVPGMELSRLGYEIVLDAQMTRANFDACDVLVMQRQHRPEALAALREANASGKLTVYDLDDDIWHIPTSNPAHSAWEMSGLKERATAMVREAGLVTTPSRTLAEAMGVYSSSVRVLPNCLPSEHWDFQPEFRRREPVIVGWAGSPSHADDLDMFAPIVENLLDATPNAHFQTIGPMVQHWPIEPHERHVMAPSVTIEPYGQALRPFDIGVAPLVNHAFNRAKSDLKYVEYGMVGLPVVAQHLDPYMHTIKHGENGYLAKNAKDWLKYLKLLVNDADLRESMGRAARAYAETRTIDKKIHQWIEAYGLAEVS